MKTLTCKTRWIGALVMSLFLAGLASGTALADDAPDPDGLYPDCPPLYPESPEDPDDLYPDIPPQYPQPPVEPIDVFANGSLILTVLPFLVSVAAR